MSGQALDANLVVLDKATKALQEHLVKDATRVPEIGETIYTGELPFCSSARSPIHFQP
jgi:hypothetical protein